MADSIALPQGFVLDETAGRQDSASSSVPQGFVLDDPEPGFFQRIGQRAQEREMKIQESLAAPQTGIEKVFQQTGQAAGFLGDVLFETIGTGVSAVGDVTGLKEKTKESAKKIAESPIGQTGIEALQEGVEAWDEFSSSYPRVARNIEAAVNVGSIVVPSAKYGEKALSATGKGVSQSLKMVDDVGQSLLKKPKEGIQNLVSGMTARSADELDDVVDLLKKQASSSYTRAKDYGAVLNKNKGVGIGNKINRIVREEGKLNKKLHGDTISVLNDLKIRAKQGDLSLEELDQFRQLLGQVVTKNTDITGMKPDALKASIAIDALDDAVDELGKVDIIGGNVEAINAFNKARSQWSQSKKFETISNLVKKADGDPNKIRSAFKKLSENKKKLRGFSKDEIKIIKSIGNPGKADKILKGLGRFGIDEGNVFLPIVSGGLGAATGYGLPGAALVGVGTVARQVRKFGTRAEPEELLKLIQKIKQ